MPKGEGLMDRSEICNCPWRFKGQGHREGQRETKRERDMEEGKEGEVERRRKKGCPDTVKSALASLLLASLLADWSRRQSTREPEKRRPL